MIIDIATPWVRHILIDNTSTCRRCGVQLRTGESLLDSEIFVKDGRILIGQPPFRRWEECSS